MRSGLKWLSVLTCVGMFLVLLDGALVTKTGSGMGCGSDWPLCNGKFVPAYTLQSMIEYSHRAVTGLVGILVVASMFFVWKSVPERKDAKLFAASALFFTVLQALMGAMAVVKRQSSLVMALHFGFSLMAFASTLLLAIVMWQRDKALKAARNPGGQAGGAEAGETSAKPQTSGQAVVSVAAPFRNWVYFTLVYCYAVVYIGAYVRHTKSTGGCFGWPLCNGEVIPELSGATGIVYMHRVAALLLFCVIGWMTISAVRKYRNIPAIFNASVLSLILVSAQILSGAIVTKSIGSDYYLFASLLHNVLIAALFGVLCYLGVVVYQLRKKTQ